MNFAPDNKNFVVCLTMTFFKGKRIGVVYFELIKAISFTIARHKFIHVCLLFYEKITNQIWEQITLKYLQQKNNMLLIFCLMCFDRYHLDSRRNIKIVHDLDFVVVYIYVKAKYFGIVTSSLASFWQLQVMSVKWEPILTLK